MLITLNFLNTIIIMYSERNKCLCIQQAPEEIERVLVGIQAYLSIRRHTSDSGLSFFEDDESGGDLVEKVCFPSAIHPSFTYS